MYSQHSSSSNEQYEEEIIILQSKLKEVHDKLMDQLDVCKEQELTIIELTTKNEELQSQTSCFKYQSFGIRDSKENELFNGGGLSDAKQKLLQSDLEAMRGKVLLEIMEKNKLKEELKEIKKQQGIELAVQQKRIEQLDNMLRKINEENGLLRDKYERIKRDKNRADDNELEKMAARIGELEGKYEHERNMNIALQKEKQSWQENLYGQDERQRQRQFDEDIQQRREVGRGKNIQSIQYRDTESMLTMTKQQKEIDHLKLQLERLSKNVEMKEMEVKEVGYDRKRRRGYDETKELIRKLEEAESEVRKRKRNRESESRLEVV